MTEARDSARPPVRVAIVGGGCGGLAAAWHLSQQPGYEVTVYESSWRLGGKGASVRDAHGRIRDHGLHIWLGFYENAFRMARECYEEVSRRGWGPHAAPNTLTHGSFEDAFFPEPHIGVAGRDAHDDWVVWSGHLPPAPGLPGDPFVPGDNPFTLANYMLRCLELLKTLMVSVIGPPKDAPGVPRGSDDDPPDVVIERIATRIRDTTLTGSAALLPSSGILVKILDKLSHSIETNSVEPSKLFGRVLNLLRALLNQTAKELADVVSLDPKLRWKTEIIDIVRAIAAGLYRDRVLFGRKGLDAINGEDYRAWLSRHGASDKTLQSRFLEGIYDFLFAYEGGDRKKGNFAAGVALRGALRMFFTYRGAMFWRMRSGMGDAVFAPLYKVMLLADRKAKRDPAVTLPAVKFRFLHELRGVTLGTGPRRRQFVTALHFRTVGDPEMLASRGDKALDTLGCWPDGPRQFQEDGKPGSPGAKTVKISEHFDAVILAMSIEDLKTLRIGAEEHGDFFLSKMPQEWRTMADQVATVATKAAQVWLAKDLEGLGWYRGSVLVSALGQRFDTWADMTHTLGSERAWREGMKQKPSDEDKALSVAYFCAAMSNADASVPDPNAKVAADLDAMLTGGMRPLWPAAFDGGTTPKPDVIGDTHAQANTKGSDRYVQSRFGTIDKRISPLEAPVANMTIAGDWTACGLDVGCIEAAVMSGMLAAHAITGREPTLDSIVGYDHP